MSKGAVAADTTGVAVGRPGRTSRTWAILRCLARLVIGCVLCLSPVTSVLALGWLTRFTRRAAIRRLARLAGSEGTPGPGAETIRASACPEWFAGRHGGTLAARVFGGLARNVSEGISTVFTLFVATIAFSLPWLLGWWAGWENSFNKGYEQSWVGPVVSLAAIFVALNVLTYLPMALAHQAVERNWRAFFDLRRIRTLIANAGWRYIALASLSVIAALPLFAMQSLPVFIEEIAPGFNAQSAEDVEQAAGLFALFSSAYAFTSLIVLRWFAARIYAHAFCRAYRTATDDLWQESAAAPLLESRPRNPRSTLRKGLFRTSRPLQLVILWIVWFGLVAQIYAAQFFNYQWWSWLTHPFYLLPWAG